jgi:hypothetical protein
MKFMNKKGIIIKTLMMNYLIFRLKIVFRKFNMKHL